MIRHLLAWACSGLVLLLAPARAQEIPPRDQRSTGTFVAYYEESESWPVRALALLSLGPHWHPVASPAVADALAGKDERMRPFGLEALRRTRPDVLKAIATEPIVDALLDLARSRHPLVRSRAIELLGRLAGDDSIRDKRAAETWWRTAKREGYAPADWPAIDDGEPRDSATRSAPVLERALDLREAGLDLVIVIDSTGSMQAVIDKAVEALDDVIEVLGSLAPGFRVGLVHYRDFGDFAEGARLLVPLAARGNAVRDELSRLRAGGGGDLPERVERGLEVALDRATRWSPDANHLILLVGDAPPHVETETALLAMVRDAHANGVGARRRAPTTGARKPPRPVVVSTLSTHRQADRPFREIAEASGGTFATLGARGRDQPEQSAASQTIVRHVLAASFGSALREQVDDFVSIWFEYRDSAGR